jgi:hypothetical protein
MDPTLAPSRFHAQSCEGLPFIKATEPISSQSRNGYGGLGFLMRIIGATVTNRVPHWQEELDYVGRTPGPDRR